MFAKTIVNASLLASTLLILAGCVMNKVDPSASEILLRESGRGSAVSIEIVPGDEYLSTMRAGPLIFNVLPQFVVWTEDSDGRLLETLYITGADYGKMRHAGKAEKGVLFYQESFPVWSSRAEQRGERLPSKYNPYPDTLTSATPAAGTVLHTYLDTEEKATRILLEINKSGDENEAYGESQNGWAGQPSLIYAAELEQMGASGTIPFELIGHGGTIFQEPAVYPNLGGFDSALEEIAELRLMIVTDSK